MKLGKYRHYKKREYEVTGFAVHSETLEEMVIYTALYNSEEFGEHATWVRPRKMFEETVVLDGTEVPRFEFIG